MKKILLMSLGVLAVMVPLKLSSAQLGPVWQGPQKATRWLGLALATPAAASTPQAQSTADDGAPKWVGYVNRGQGGSVSGVEWFFRLRLANGKSEMVRRGGSTSDGWSVVSFGAQANRPSSVTISKNGAEKTLQLTPDL